MYRDHRKGPGGPSGGATYPGGPHGLKWEGNQPLVGWCAPPWAPHAPRVGNPRGGGASTCLGGHSTPLGRRPPRDPISRAGAPLGSLYKEGGGRAAAPLPWRSPPSSYSSFSSVVRSEALPENHELHRHHVVVLLEFSLNFSSPLAGSRRRRRPRAVRVLNAEAPSVRR